MSKATIKDVAKAANVSISTVSRFVTSSKAVKDDTAERIRKAICELQYVPNANARSLKNSATYVVGIIITDISNMFFSSLCKSLESVLYEHGYSLMIFSSDEDAEKERTQIELLREKRVDGIVISPTGKNIDLLLSTMESGIPVVAVDRYLDIPELDYVVENNEESAYTLTKYMLSQGHRRIAFVRGLETAAAGIARCAGYTRALREFNIPVDDSLIFNTTSNNVDGEVENTVERMMARIGDISCVLLANPRVFEAFLSLAKKKDIRVPTELSFAVFTTAKGRAFFPVELTCAVQNPELIGVYTGKQIMQRIRTEKNSLENHGNVIKIDMNIEFGQTVMQFQGSANTDDINTINAN